MNLVYTPASTCEEVILQRPACVSIRAVIVASRETLPPTLISTGGRYNTSAWSLLLPQLRKRKDSQNDSCLFV